MRLPGWCEKCHKVKTVNVPIPQPPYVGICDDCEHKK